MDFKTRKILYSGWIGISLLCICFSCGEEVASIPKKIDFNFHVRPILSDKCFACHGPDVNKNEANLRLDLPEFLHKTLEDDPSRFVIVPNRAEESELFHRISAIDSTLLMPPPESKLSLSSREIKILKRWIDQGAEYKKHWAFEIPQKSELPKVKESSFSENEIDYFVLATMEERGLKPSEEASPERILKRVCFDMTGLPPDPQLYQEFVIDKSLDYEALVSRLLASPHYGEKMAIPWLDAARYADSHGYQDDGLRTMWPWRDWVIHAFNENYSYDQFVRWQLAGDLLPDPNKEMLLATGFNRNHKITQEGGVIDEEYRIEYVTDRTNTFGKTFLGLTFECAKCHDHKYDPISMEEYYSTFSFFDKVPEKGIFGTIDASYADPPNMKISEEDVHGILDFINKKDTMPLEVMIMKDSIGIRSTHVLERGNYDAKGDTVSFATPAAILPFDQSKFQPNRLGLVEWLFDEKNPLTARVFVNRIWEQFFGRALVATPGDFGMQGDLPTHPQLLDWLAVDFRESGWDIKHLVTMIVTSATYRQSAKASKRQLDKDPENIYLSHMARRRLSAELVRDHVLASSKLLNNEIGGPSVKPYQPNGMWAAASSGRGSLQFYVQDDGPDLYRRGLYTFIKRTVPPPTMLMFDASPRDQCEVSRLQTNTPLQALVMMNDPTVLEASRILAYQLLETEGDIDQKLDKASIRILSRQLASDEKEILLEFYNSEKSRFTEDHSAAEQLISIGDYSVREKVDPLEWAALMQVVHTFYNMEEAIVLS